MDSCSEAEGVANFDPDFEDKVDVISPILAYWSWGVADFVP